MPPSDRSRSPRSGRGPKATPWPKAGQGGPKPARGAKPKRGPKPERAFNPDRGPKPERAFNPERGPKPERAFNAERGPRPERTFEPAPAVEPERGPATPRGRRSELRIDASKLKSIAVLFEDDELLAVAKPPGMSVHGGAGEKGPTLIDLVRAAYPDGGASVNLVHRLDRATSGLILLAKTAEIASRVGKAWETAEKTYLAIALGHLDEALTIDAPLEEKHGGKKAAVTYVHPVAQLRAVKPHTTLLSITLGTGRTHQIRLHLAELHHPLMMDEKHGDFAANKEWGRALKDAITAKGGSTRAVKHLMLHSWKLAITHPRSGERIELSREPPDGWADILREAGRGVDVLARLS